MEKKTYPGVEYQKLFDYLSQNHGLTPLLTEMDDLIDFIHKYYTHPLAVNQPGAWVKGAPKEQKEHFAKVKSMIEEGVVYDAIIWPIKGSDYWWCVGKSFKFDAPPGVIIEHLDESAKPSESPAEQPVVDNARYELSHALRTILKVFKNTPKTYDQEERCKTAEALLKKHSKVTDVLRTNAAVEQPVREVEYVFAYTPCMEDDPDYCGDYTSNDGRDLCRVKEIQVPMPAIKQKAEWSGEKEGSNG